MPRIEPAGRLRPRELPSLQVGGTPVTCQDNDFIVPPCAKCGKKLFFIMGCEPFHLHHDHGSKLSWGDCGEYLLFACPKCFAGGEPGTYYVEGNCF